MPCTAEETNANRFWTSVSRGDVSACWLWLGTINSRGYGHFYIAGKTIMAHRFAFEVSGGRIPAGLTIDHLCRNKPCVNPAHLECVTSKENILRGASFSAVNATKTHCLHGHPLSGDNLYASRGRRYCRTCRRVDALARYHAKKAA